MWASYVKFQSQVKEFLPVDYAVTRSPSGKLSFRRTSSPRAPIFIDTGFDDCNSRDGSLPATLGANREFGLTTMQGNARTKVNELGLLQQSCRIGHPYYCLGTLQIFLLSLAFILVPLLSTPAHSGELRVAQTYKGYCDLEFIGAILKGDAKKFDYDSIENLGTQGASVCLDSAGGSFPEAISIAKNSDMLGMVIPPGAKCLSACAILFSGGRISLGMGIPLEYLNRVIWPGGLLGYHAPSLEISDSGTFSKSDVDQAFSIALASTKEIYNLNNRYGVSQSSGSTKLISDYVFGLILDTPPTEMHNIEIVGEAILSNFDVPTTDANKPLDKNSTLNVCENKYLHDNYQYSTIVRTDALSDNIPNFIGKFVSNHDEGINVKFTKVGTGKTTGLGIVFPVLNLSANGGNEIARTNICIVQEMHGDENTELYVTLHNLQAATWDYDPPLQSNSEDLENHVFNFIYKSYVTDLGEDDYSMTDFKVDPIYKIDPLRRIAELTPASLREAGDGDADEDGLPLRVIPEGEHPPEATDATVSIDPDETDGASAATTPQPAQPANFNNLENTDLGGNVLATLKEKSLEDCVSSCASDKHCKAYTYDRWNRWCFTKTEATDRSVSAKAVSGFLAKLLTPPMLKGPIEMRRYRGKAFPGVAYRSDKEPNSEACESACRNDGDCIAYTFRKPKQQCERFRSAPEYDNDRRADSGAKFQTR